MPYVCVRMNDTGEVRCVPTYVAEHLFSRQRATGPIPIELARPQIKPVETAMESPAIDPQVEQAVAPAQDPQPRTARRRR